MRIEIEIPGGIPGDLGDLEVAFRSLRVVYDASGQGVLVFSPRRKRDMLSCVVALEVMCYQGSSLHAAGPRLDVVAALSQRKLDMPRIERVLEEASEELQCLFQATYFAYNGAVNIRKDDSMSSDQQCLVRKRLNRIGIALGSVAYLQRICEKIQTLSASTEPFAA